MSSKPPFWPWGLRLSGPACSSVGRIPPSFTGSTQNVASWALRDLSAPEDSTVPRTRSSAVCGQREVLPLRVFAREGPLRRQTVRPVDSLAGQPRGPPGVCTQECAPFELSSAWGKPRTPRFTRGLRQGSRSYGSSSSHGRAAHADASRCAEVTDQDNSCSTSCSSSSTSNSNETFFHPCRGAPANSNSASRTSHSVYRGYRFDRMLDTLHPDPATVAALDALSLCTLKTVVLPGAVLHKLQLLLQHVGKKKDLEKTGRLLADKTTARTSVELPRVLPSQLLPEAKQILAEAAVREATLQQDQAQPTAAAAADRRREPTASSLLMKGRDTRILRSLPGATEAMLSILPPEGLEAQEALAAAEDARHPLYRHVTTGHSPLTAAAWTAHRFAGVYAPMLRILTEIKTRCPSFFPKRVLEMNAGFAAGLIAVDAVYGQQLEDDDAAVPRKQGKASPAAAALGDTAAPVAAATGAEEDRDSIELLMAVEPSTHLASVGRYLTADMSPSVQWQLGLYDEGLRRRQKGETEKPEAADDRFDLVLLPHSLLRSVDGQASRHALVRTLWNRIKPGGLLVMLERGTASGFRVLASVRELFICELGTERFHFVAPCPHESVCPLALTGRDWCHFGQRVRRVPHHLYCKGSRAKSIEEEKYSFLAVRKGQGPRSRFRSLAAAEAAGAPAEDLSFFWPRLVAPPIKGREHVLLDVCAAPHRFERVAISKHMPHGAGYKAARHAAWGDLWRHPRRIIRPDARAYMQQEIREAADKKHQKKVDINQRPEMGQERERVELDETLIRNFGA